MFFFILEQKSLHRRDVLCPFRSRINKTDLQFLNLIYQDTYHGTSRNIFWVANHVTFSSEWKYEK